MNSAFPEALQSHQEELQKLSFQPSNNMTSTLPSHSLSVPSSSPAVQDMGPEATSNSKKAISFENLPSEVRNKIYRYLLSTQYAGVK